MKTNPPFKIISTLGSASLSPEFLKLCMRVAQPNFRLNGSHLTRSELQKYFQILRKNTALEKTEIYLDLQGNKLRIGKLKNQLRLAPEMMVKLKAGNYSGSDDIPVPHLEIFKQAAVGDLLQLQDAEIKLVITEIKDKTLKARVVEGGNLRSKAGLNFPGRQIILTRKSTIPGELLHQAQFLGIQNLALSFVRSRADLQQLKNSCRKLGYFPRIIAKIENPESLKNLETICRTADEIWFCRGDLGSLIPWKELGYWQDYSIEMANRSGKPIMIAGQVFQHLTEHSQPTRSELVHFYQLQKAGAAGLILSDETALGKNPAVALKVIVDLL
jgi:pyruvate kinase